VRLWKSNGEPWDGSSGAILAGHTDRVLDLVVLEQSSIFISASVDATLRVWDFAGKPGAVLNGHTNWVFTTCVLPGRGLVTGSVDKTLRLWNEVPGAGVNQCMVPGAELIAHEDCVMTTAMLPDGRIISGSDDHTVRVWSADGTSSKVFRGHNGAVTCVCALLPSEIAASNAGISSVADSSWHQAWRPVSRHLLRGGVGRGPVDATSYTKALQGRSPTSPPPIAQLGAWDNERKRGQR